MIFRRLLPAAVLTAGLASSAIAQEPPKPATDKPADTPAAATPAANPDVDKAREALGAGKLDEALKHLEEAAKKDKQFPLPKIKLAEIILEGARDAQGFQLARQLIETASLENKEHPEPYIVSGVIALREGRVMDALLLFEHGLNKASSPAIDVSVKPRFVRTCREGLAQCYRARQDYNLAKTQLELILADEKTNSSVRKDLAFLTFLFGEKEKALELLKQAFKDDPKNAAIGLPEVNMSAFWKAKPVAGTTDAAKKADEAENNKQSEEWLKKALAEYPKDVRAPREYGRWLLNAGRVDDADKQLAAAAAIDANDDETQALTGLSFRYKKNYKEAVRVFDELNRKNRNVLAYAWNLALSKAELEDKKEREAAVDLANFYMNMNNQQRNAEGMCILAYCLFKVERYEEADKMFGAALQASGGRLSPDSIYYLCKLMEKRDKGKEAVARLKIAVDSKDPFVTRQDAEAFYKALVAKHGEPKDEKKEDKKPEDKKPEEKKP